ncbi:MAG: hypothetical protein KC731_31880 [Myxococcales bacterium]|nr:hypothetical protein [Myxococcales bacterium]
MLAAKENDQIVAVDTHIVMVPSPGGPVPTPMPMPYNGKLKQGLCSSVLVEDLQAATDGSVALNDPPHVPTGGSFQVPPNNQATIKKPSGTVLFEDKPAACLGDIAETCNDPAAAPVGTVVVTQSSVLIGG